jgi:Isochorismatase family
MSSEPVRDPVTDHLLTPRNCALAIVDYQPIQVKSVRSIDHEELVANVVRVAETATTYGLPIVLTTVNVSTGANGPTISRLTDVLPGVEAIDRTTMNSWEDLDFRRAVEATGRTKLVMVALWTEVCLTFPLLDAMRQGYEASGIRGVPRRRRRRRHLGRSPSDRVGTPVPGGRAASELGAVRLRVAARLGPSGDGRVVQGDRLRPTRKFADPEPDPRAGGRLARIVVTIARVSAAP